MGRHGGEESLSSNKGSGVPQLIPFTRVALQLNKNGTLGVTFPKAFKDSYRIQAGQKLQLYFEVPR